MLDALRNHLLDQFHLIDIRNIYCKNNSVLWAGPRSYCRSDSVLECAVQKRCDGQLNFIDSLLNKLSGQIHLIDNLRIMLSLQFQLRYYFMNQLPRQFLLIDSLLGLLWEQQSIAMSIVQGINNSLVLYIF